jgi:hypothetical protein
VIGGDLEKLRGVSEAMDLVQDHHTPCERPKHCLGILPGPPGARKFQIEVFGSRESLTENCFPGPPDAGKPDNGTLPTGLLDFSPPEASKLHVGILAYSATKRN